MDIASYLSSRTATVVRNPSYSDKPAETQVQSAMTGGYSKPNLQMDLQKTFVVPPLNTEVTFSSDLPQHRGYHLNLASSEKNLPDAQPSDVASELAKFLGVARLPSTADIYSSRNAHMLDNLKKNSW